MPKVSDEHRRGRRDQILTAARHCFRRDGFRATSMQDLLKEAGLSAGAFYLHFASKDDLIVAVAEDNVREVLAIIRGRGPESSGESLGELLAAAVATVTERHDRDGFADLAVHVWAEALTNPLVAERLGDLLTELRAALAAAAASRGLDTDGSSSTQASATVLAAILPGLILQLAVSGRGTLDGVGPALEALLPQRIATEG